jgi:hypothetical protein
MEKDAESHGKDPTESPKGGYIELKILAKEGMRS